MLEMIRNEIGYGFLGAAAIGFAACAGDGSSTDAPGARGTEAAVEGQAYELTGNHSVALGIARWSVEDNHFRAFDANAKQVAELRLDQPSQTVESLSPEPGVLNLRDHSGTTFSEQSLKVFEALKSDLQTMVQTQPREELGDQGGNVDKAGWVQLACFYTNASCVAAGQQLLFSGQILDYRCHLFDTVCDPDSLLEVLVP